MSNYVTVTAEVEFDMEDYIDDILEKLSDEELIKSLRTESLLFTKQHPYFKLNLTIRPI